MCTAQIVDMEPHIFRPAVSYQVLISRQVSRDVLVLDIRESSVLSTLSLPTYMNAVGSTTLLVK
jgi:hypothetical protein